MEGNLQRQKRGRRPRLPETSSIKRAMSITSESEDEIGDYDEQFVHKAGITKNVMRRGVGNPMKKGNSLKARWVNQDALNYEAVESDDSYELVRVAKKKSKDISEGSSFDAGRPTNQAKSWNGDNSDESYSQPQGKRFASKGGRVGPSNRPKTGRGRTTQVSDCSQRNSEEVSEAKACNEHTPLGVNYMSNMHTLVKTLRRLRLTERLVPYLKRTPFWWFAKALIEMEGGEVLKRFKKKDFAITRIMRRFHCDGTRKGFLFGDKFLVPTRDDMQLVFGIRSGHVAVQPGSGSVKVTGFLRRCFPDKVIHMNMNIEEKGSSHYKLHTGLLLEKLEEILEDGDNADGEDVARLLHLYLLGVFFVPNLSSAVHWRITEYVADFDRICDYDWSSYILNDLMGDIKIKSNLRMGTCAMFLPYWLCEYTNLISPVSDYPTFPRFMKWDVSEFGQVILGTNLDELGSVTKIQKRIRATELELKLLVDELDESEDEVFEEGCSGGSEVMNMEKRRTTGLEGGLVGRRDTCYRNNGKDPVVVGKGKTTLVGANGSGPSMEVKRSNVPRDGELPKFELGFDDNGGDPVLPQQSHDVDMTGGFGSPLSNDNSWVDSIFSEGPSVKVSSPGLAEVTVHFKSPDRKQGRKQLFPGDACDVAEKDRLIKDLRNQLEKANTRITKLKGDLEINDADRDIAQNVAEKDQLIKDLQNQLEKANTRITKLKGDLEIKDADRDLAQTLAEKDQLIKDLQNQLEKANTKITKLKCDLEVKDADRDLTQNDALEEYRRQSEDMLDGLRASLTEMEQVKIRLGYQTRADKQKIEKLEKDNWHLGDKLSLEIAAHLAVVAEKESIDKSNLENYKRKLALAIENDGLNAEITRLNFQLDNLGPISHLDQVRAAVESVVNMNNTVGENSGTGQLAGAQANVGVIPEVTAVEDKGGHGSCIVIDQPGSGQKYATPSPSAPVAKFGGNCGSSSTNHVSDSKIQTPVTVKIEPADDYGSGSACLIKSDSPDNPNTMIMRVQERTMLNLRKKKDLGTPIALFPAFNKQAGHNHSKVLTNVIRPMSVNRNNVAYKRTFPNVIAWLLDRFNKQLPSDTLLSVEMSYMNNFVTLYNIESLLNNQMLDEAVIDTWGLLVIQLNNAEGKALADRTLVSRQTYLFKSFLWLQVARFDMDYSYKSMVAQFLDKKIRDALEFETWLFPINTTGALNSRTNVGDHWTLLKFTVSTCAWVFYNPLSPQRADLDEHYKAARILINHVEKQIKLEAVGRRLPIFRQDHKLKLEWCTDMPQQAHGTLDCGVVVCALMESIVRKWEINRAQWTSDDGGKNRAYMVNVFAETVIADEKAAEEAAKLAKK